MSLATKHYIYRLRLLLDANGTISHAETVTKKQYIENGVVGSEVEDGVRSLEVPTALAVEAAAVLAKFEALFAAEEAQRIRLAEEAKAAEEARVAAAEAEQT